VSFSWDRFTRFVQLNSADIWRYAVEHVEIVLAALAIALVLGVAIAVVTYRTRLGAQLAVTGAGVILTIPSFALLGLLIPPFGLGTTPVLIALVLYSLLPIVRNTIVGLRGVDPQIVDGARGCGMSTVQRLVRVELPLAWPVIVAGLRVAAQLAIGIAAIAAYVRGPGLGTLIFNGISSLGSFNAINQVIVGTLGVVVIALAFDLAFVVLAKVTAPRGIRA
jgi:osmoprotectant transport system permease protein